MPEDVSGSACRVIHICVSMIQPWYELPDDGLPRLKRERLAEYLRSSSFDAWACMRVHMSHDVDV
eukprot:3429325-Prymnesium_polylepis.1